MSCPARQSSIPPDDFKGDPMAIIYTLGFTAIVIAVSLAYRKIWTAYWDQRIGPLGMRQIGKSGDRNLSREFAEEYQKSKERTVGADEWRVEALFDHPVKSTYPIEVRESIVQAHGLEHDRQFCFAQWHEPKPADGEEAPSKPKAETEKGTSSWWAKRRHWSCLTQRKTPRLTLVKTEIWVPDPYSRDYDEEDEYVKSGGCLVVKFPLTPSWNPLSCRFVFVTRLVTWNWKSEVVVSFRLPLNPTAEQIRDRRYTNDNFNIFRDYPSGLDMSSEIPKNTWNQLRYTLDQPKGKAGIPNNRLALFRLDLTKERNLYKCAPTEEQLGYQAHLSYQDSYPLSIQNMSSIMSTEEECQKIEQVIKFKPDSRRYRGNIYISGPKAFDEDDWTLLQIGDHRYHVSCRTTRCQMPLNDPDKGVLTIAQREPQNWLLKNRKIDKGSDAGCLGMQMVPTKDAVGSVIRVGDVVKVLKRGEHRAILQSEPEFQRPVF